ncbi:restriction endonuclease subunit S [Streptococcus hyovaginalis]|uniref:restriction endonuclease subunit S n=1 Tax=Streptococcus hyovaginalis TaxID=149015 RepID=UPI0009FC6508|nr:restriction endonuclease subunit S [Streptococcus hyovaginalis]
MTSDYKTTSLGAVVDFIAKGIPPKYTDEKNENSIVVLNQKTNRNFQIDYSVARLNDLTKKKVAAEKLLKDNDILINSTGVGTAGRIAQLFSVPEPTTVDGHMIILRADCREIDPIYLGYALKSQQPKIESLQEGSTGQTELNRQRLLDEIQISFPKDRGKQEAIGSIFLSIDNRIEQNKEINHHLEQVAVSIFDEMFPNVNSGEHTIGEYITPKRGKGLLSKNAVAGSIPVIAGGLQPATYHNTANTKAPVVTISASGANAGYVGLWNTSVWSSDSSFIDSVMTDNVYFWYIMLSKRQQEIYDMQTGSAQPHIYPKHISIMPTIELEQSLVDEYNSRVTPLFETIGANTLQNRKLEETRDSLLPKLMSGELTSAD